MLITDLIMEIPTCIKYTRTCVNVKTDDNQLFKWAVLAALHPMHNGYRLTPYKIFENEFDFRRIEFPVRLSQIPQFEKQNDISIDVYSLQDYKSLSVLHKTIKINQNHVDLFLTGDHFFRIKDLPRLLQSFVVSTDKITMHQP